MTQDVTTMRRAGLVHDLGRLGISNAIWDKPGPLGAGEWERVRLHPYLTERMLRQSPLLAPLGAIAAQHRERLDGSGYPAGLAGGAISRFARLLGAADAYQSMREPRPYRAALTAEAAARELRDEAQLGPVRSRCGRGRARGGRARRPPPGGAARRADRARGRGPAAARASACPSKQIAARLVISPKTARNHVEHIYAKTGLSSRAQASLFAVQHGLLPADEYVTDP